MEIKDLISLGTPLITIITFTIGLKIWKNQLVYKEKRQLASELLATLYELKDIFHRLRSPFGYTVPISEEDERHYKDKDEIEAYNEYRLFQIRYKESSAQFKKFQALKYKYLVLIAKSDEKYFNELLNIVTDISNAAQGMGDFKYEAKRIHTPRYYESMDNLLKEWREMMYGGGSNDKVEIKIEKIIKHFEYQCYKLLN